MKARKVVEFLLLKPAFTSRNISSVLLVGVFFALYVMAGGKVTWVPKVNAHGGAFGSMGQEGRTLPGASADLSRVSGPAAAEHHPALPAVSSVAAASSVSSAAGQDNAGAKSASSSSSISGGEDRLDQIRDRLKHMN